jgi:hypothetical protein
VKGWIRGKDLARTVITGVFAVSVAFWAGVSWALGHFYGLGWLPVAVGVGLWALLMLWSLVRNVWGIVSDQRKTRAWKRRVAGYVDERLKADVAIQPVPPVSVTRVRDAIGNVWGRTGTNRWDIVRMSEDLPGKRVQLQAGEETALGWGRLSQMLGPLVPVDDTGRLDADRG